MSPSRARRLPPPVLGLFALLALLALQSRPLPAAAQPAPDAYVPGEVLVAFNAGASAAQAAQVSRGLGAVVVQRFADPGLQRLALPEGLSTEAAIRALANSPVVAYAQPNFIYHAIATPTDPKFTNGDLWALHNTGQNGGTPDADIDAPEAWDLSTGSASVAVAVIDTGVDYTHPDLADNIWTNPGEIPGNGIDDEGNGYVDDVHGWDAYSNDGDPMDQNEHGTHVAGTIGAAANNIAGGVVGVNWNVRIIATRFLSASGTGSTADAIECMDYIHKLKDSGVVNVIATNNSWGGSGYDLALKSAIEASNARGILYVAAAGNGDFFGFPINNDANPQYPASFDNANVIAVTATDRNDRKASWANYGATSVDLGAPGVDIWSTVRSGGYSSFSGTSMATPHVTGAAALLLSYVPTLTHLQVKDRLLASVDPNADLKSRTVTGGRLNLSNALTGTVIQPPPPTGSTLQVAVSTDKAEYRFGEYIWMFVNVTDGSGNPVGGADVSLEVITPKGWRYTSAGFTDDNGDEIFLGQAARSDGRGTYKVNVTASKAGYQNGTRSTTFRVR
jgi:serine protease